MEEVTIRDYLTEGDYLIVSSDESGVSIMAVEQGEAAQVDLGIDEIYELRDLLTGFIMRWGMR